MACMEDDVRRMPMGLHTVVSEGGGGFSGGQKQRILIARALISKPNIIFFDEATSALDNIAQKSVSDNLDKLRCTRVVIAHRLSTIRHCDRIVVLDKGHIAEQGTFEELMANKGLFYEMAQRQL
jgi:ABC-type bacteriocin/lantibiotic exporter with double-glycine peptidase domain